MRARDAERELIRGLVEAGIPVKRGVHPDLDWMTAEQARRVWDVFKEFGRIPAEDVDTDNFGDGLLCEVGVHDFDFLGGRRFHVSLVRQFSFDKRGEYDHMEQLHCCLLYEPTPELEGAPDAMLWSFRIPLDEFFRQVEQLLGFRIAMEGDRAPVGVWIEQERV